MPLCCDNAPLGPRLSGSQNHPTFSSVARPLLCLTGELAFFARDEAINLAKHGGQVAPPSVTHSLHRNHSRVTPQPSSKTSYVVLGDNVGSSKLVAIKRHVSEHSPRTTSSPSSGRVALGARAAKSRTQRRAGPKLAVSVRKRTSHSVL